MVKCNLGVSIAPMSCVPAMTQPHLKRLPLGPDAPVRQLGLISRDDSAKARVVEETHGKLLAAVAGATGPSEDRHSGDTG